MLHLTLFSLLADLLQLRSPSLLADLLRLRHFTLLVALCHLRQIVPLPDLLEFRLITLQALIFHLSPHPILQLILNTPAQLQSSISNLSQTFSAHCKNSLQLDIPVDFLAYAGTGLALKCNSL